jgi:hypothetical protein
LRTHPRRAARHRVRGGLIATFDEIADEQAFMEDEIADAAYLSMARDRLRSAKDSA